MDWLMFCFGCSCLVGLDLWNGFINKVRVGTLVLVLLEEFLLLLLRTTGKWEESTLMVLSRTPTILRRRPGLKWICTYVLLTPRAIFQDES